MIEIWRDIPGFENRYRISNLGRVMGVVSNKIKKFQIDGGYLTVGFAIGGKNSFKRKKRLSIHRLVLLAFVGPSDLQCNHKNGIKTDNRLENLEYCTAKENTHHSLYILGNINKRKPRSPKQMALRLNRPYAPGRKLSDAAIADIRKKLSLGAVGTHLAKYYKVTPATISYIKQGKIWANR